MLAYAVALLGYIFQRADDTDGRQRAGAAECHADAGSYYRPASAGDWDGDDTGGDSGGGDTPSWCGLITDCGSLLDSRPERPKTGNLRMI